MGICRGSGNHARFESVPRFVCILICAVLGTGPAAAGGVPEARDLSADAGQVAQHKTPLVVMFSRDDCPYCDVVRDRYLVPLIEDSSAAAPVLVRVVHLGHHTPLKDFSGRTSTHTAFARAQGVDFVPTLRFFDAGGRMLVPDMIGLMLEDFYALYLTASIGDAQAKLAGRAD